MAPPLHLGSAQTNMMLLTAAASDQHNKHERYICAWGKAVNKSAAVTYVSHRRKAQHTKQRNAEPSFVANRE